MSRTNELLRKFNRVRQALKHQAALLALPYYIRYVPHHMKPRPGERYNGYGETLPADREAERQAAALRVPIKEYGFDPEEEGTELEPSPVPVIEFQEWDDIPPAIETE